MAASMSTSDAPFGWRHALGCAAIIAGTAAALLLLCGIVHAQTVNCVPASLQAVTGKVSDRGAWAATRCPNGINIIACATDHCTSAVMTAAMWIASHPVGVSGANYALAKYGAGGICAPAVKAVWWPDRFLLKQDLNATDAQVAAICPGR